MPIALQNLTYEWLKSINIFKMPPTKSPSNQHQTQIPYDEQIYLQNGYLIGLTLKKIFQINHPYQLELLKVRKIAILKSSENWEIIEPILEELGFSLSQQEDEDNINISENTIADILEFLMENFGPMQLHEKKHKNKKKKQWIEIQNFQKSKPLSQANNSLQLMALLLTNNFNIDIGQALGLVINKCENMKKVLVYGSLIDNYDGVLEFYNSIYENWETIEELLQCQSKGYEYFFMGPAEGLLSQNDQVVEKTIKILGKINDGEWFLNFGYLKCLQSSSMSVFQFLLKHLQPNYEKVLNQKLHITIKNEVTLLNILSNLISLIKKTIYARNILDCVPISYFLEQCFSILDPGAIDEQTNQVKVLARELLTKIMVNFFDRVPFSFYGHIQRAYEYTMNRSYSQQYHLIIQLTEIIEMFLKKETTEVEKYFKLLMKYLQNSFHELRNFIIISLKDMYHRMSQNFPLGCFLLMFSLDTIVQGPQFQLFSYIIEDAGTLIQDQLNLILRYLSYYFYKQIHCECFFQLIQKVIKQFGEGAKRWGEETYKSIIEKFCEVNIPMLTNSNNIPLNPRPPNKNKVVTSLGIKRREMLKYREYQSFKRVLIVLKNINDRSFLVNYRDYVGSTISKMEKQLNKKTESIKFLKSLFKIIKKSIGNVHQTQSMDQIVKSILVSRSKMNFNPNYQESNEEIQQPSVISETSQKQQEIQQKSSVKDQSMNDNEFLSNFQPEQVIPTPEIFKSPNLLLPFSEQEQVVENHPIFLLDSYFEHYEITYMKIIKEKYQQVIQKCVQIYHELSFTKSSNTLSEIMIIFLFQIGLKHYVDSDDAEVLFVKSKILHTSEYEFIEEFLMQLSFLVFGFKTGRRVNITCVQSLMLYLQDYLKERISRRLSSQSKSKVKEFNLGKNMSFQHQLSKNVYRKQSDSFFICFQVLSEIFNKSMEVHLMEPLATFVNKVILSDKQMESLENSRQIDDEIMQLEEIVGDQPKLKQQEKSSKKTINKTSNKSIGNSETEKLATRRKTDLLLLKSRISKRKIEIGDELFKKKVSRKSDL